MLWNVKGQFFFYNFFSISKKANLYRIDTITSSYLNYNTTIPENSKQIATQIDWCQLKIHEEHARWNNDKITNLIWWNSLRHGYAAYFH